jgi:hypothetical protein
VDRAVSIVAAGLGNHTVEVVVAAESDVLVDEDECCLGVTKGADENAETPAARVNRRPLLML